MKKFYPSSAAFMIGDTVMTKYDGGCLRSILIKSNGIRTGDIHPVYKRVGKAHEDNYHAELLADPANVAVCREVQLVKGLSETVEYRSRLDFLSVPKVGSMEVIHETKGTVSKNTRRDFRKGEYNISYLAQLVSYMIDHRTTRGKLVCGYYEEDEQGELKEQDRRTYKVTIGNTGRIDVDGEPSGFNVGDLFAHRLAVVEHLEQNKVGLRPDKWNQKWGGPCTNCAFKGTCDAYDEGRITDISNFMDSAKLDAEAYIEAQATKVVEINKIKVKKPAKAKKGGKKNG